MNIYELSHRQHQEWTLSILCSFLVTTLLSYAHINVPLHYARYLGAVFFHIGMSLDNIYKESFIAMDIKCDTVNARSLILS